MDSRKQLNNNKLDITIDDLYLFNFINDIYVCKNNIVFLVSKCLKEENTYITGLYAMDKNTNERTLLHLGSIKKIIHADDKYIIFAEKFKDKSLEIKRVAIRDKNVVTLFKSAEKLSNINYTKSNEVIYAKTVKLSGDNNIEDYKIFEELPFWSNSKNIVDKTRQQLFLNKNGAEKNLISNENAELIEYTLSPNHNKIAFIQNEFKDVNYTNHSILIYDIELDKTFIIKQNSNNEFADLCFFDDDTLFYTANDLEFIGKNPESFMINLQNKKVYQLPYQDAMFHGTPVTDVSYGKKAKRLISDGNFLYFTRSIYNQVHVFKMDKKGNLSQVTSGEQTVLDFGIDENDLYTISMKDTELPEIFKIDLNNELEVENEVKVTAINKEYNKTRNIIKPETFTFTNRDGIEMDVFVILPNNSKTDEKVPVILQIHGGPKAVYTDMFYHEFQVEASLGYASVYLNPRGSDGRGSEFANITGEVGYMDYNDIMEAFDKTLERYPILDKNRSYISGGSYGGLMTNWAITHTSRFKAAISQRSISNYLTKAFTTDIGYYHNIKQIGSTPWQDIELFEMHSPISYINNCTTPTLFIHSDDDYRCWQTEGIAMYNALKQKGVDARFCLLYGENHGLSRGGKPHNRILRLKEIINWIMRYSQY